MSTNPSTVPTQLIHTTGPVDEAAVYEVPGSQEIQLSSVSAEFSNASGQAIVPTLSLYSQSGQLLSRTDVKPDTVANGDAAVVTWIPFLRKQAAATPSGGSLKALRLWTSNMGLTIGNNNDGRLSFDNVTSFDPAVFSTVTSGGRVVALHYLVKGWYADFVVFDWTTNFFAGNVGITHQYTGDTLGIETQVYPSNGSGSSQPQRWGVSLTRYFPDAFDSLPGAPQILVSQTSGSSRTIDTAHWMNVYLGDSDF